jgi:hypothetical protein
MKKHILALIATLPTLAYATTSPDHKWSLQDGKAVDIVSTGNSEAFKLLNKVGPARITSLWSPDSKKVVVIENIGGGSAVFGAWLSSDGWQKTLQLDSDQAALYKHVQGKVVSERRSFGEWLSHDTIQIHGTLTLSSGKTVPYRYQLQFRQGPGHLDSGGYQEGIIKGTKYEIL